MTETVDMTGFYVWRRAWDSNPRDSCNRLHDFQSCSKSYTTWKAVISTLYAIFLKTC